MNTNVETSTELYTYSSEISSNLNGIPQGTVLTNDAGNGCCVCFMGIIVVFWIIIIVLRKHKREIKDIDESKNNKQNNSITTQLNKNYMLSSNRNVTTKTTNYNESVYYTETHISYDEMMSDKGKSGEYNISRELEKINSFKKIMFNTYLPTENDRTTEIDIIMLHSTGVYIIESKNYKGWIIGDEAHENWQQTIWKGKTQGKYFFYNPIKQNSKHILSLEKVIGKIQTISLVVFGDEATIKKAEHTNPNLYVINKKDMLKTIEKRIYESQQVYAESELEEMYQKLRPYSGYCVPEEIKEKHITNMKTNN
ncbi:MAG: NERD domain-containing protein [Firmicutes bacterium]|nr:NERD domain-containing protein [Bacillota bacterium]